MNIQNKKWFTIIELMVGILIFTIWALSAYLLVYSAINSSRYSKNEIIAANIARENIELIMNNRDNNWIQQLLWNKLNNAWQDGKTLTWWYYIIENDFSNNKTFIKIKKLSDTFSEENKKLINPVNTEDNAKLCIDSQNRYTHDCIGNKETKFYSYIKVEPLITKTDRWNKIDIENAFKIVANVVNSEKWFTRYYISTIITDWKK